MDKFNALTELLYDVCDYLEEMDFDTRRYTDQIIMYLTGRDLTDKELINEMVLLLDDAIKIVYEFSEEVGEVMSVRLGEI